MTIRVAVVVPWGVVDAWIATLVERLATSSFDVQVYRDAPASRPRSPWAYRVYELLDAHDDTAELASDYSEESWELHLDYLRSLQRRTREILARATPQGRVR